MKLTKFVKIQLAIFSVLTVIGLTVMTVVYVQLPAAFGVGVYDVTVKLAATGGLYEHANVAFRGTNVGKVKEVRLTPKGVDAELVIDSDYKIPKDVDAWVRSVSAVGEQYVDLVPAENPKGGNLSGGSVIEVERTKLPQDVGTLLDQTDRLLNSVADTKLRQVIDDAFKAFNGAGPDLQRFLDSASLLVQEAKNNTQATKDLIEKIGPLLDTQVQSDANIRSWTADLATLTDQLREHDPALRNVVRKTPGTAATATQLFQDLQPTLPLLARNLVSVGQVSSIYNPSIEQLLVVFPPLIAGLLTAATGGPIEYGAMVDFMVSLNDPVGCTVGFLSPNDRRDASMRDAPATPDNLYCKAPQNAPYAVRGIRNTPCMEYPGRRAPTPELCRDPNGYVPEGDMPLPFQKDAPGAASSNPGANSGGTSGAASGTQPASLETRSYDPKTGTVLGPDNRTYRMGNIGPDGSGVVPASLTAMVQEQMK
ncbi:MCE family protein [Nocardia inohanensis]|uniref:MCE family protein n=1 Tax=Nocardia inohanensis TaxID=209246 RepID=UPI0008373512|nr:MlaD family protein [Nocardia inohanensis]